MLHSKYKLIYVSPKCHAPCTKHILPQTTILARTTNNQGTPQYSNTIYSSPATHRSTCFTIFTYLAHVIYIDSTQACWKDRDIVLVRHSDSDSPIQKT
jgi:hypothetical protein